jgi:FkbM family methyltransferase
MALVEKFDCDVWGFDPTPKTVLWAEKQKFSPRFHFVPVGLAGKDGELEFEPPANPNYISFYPRTEAGGNTVKCRVARLETLMKELNHTRVDVLKMDIEGGEYDVIDDFLNGDVRPTQLMVEFHHDMYDYKAAHTRKSVTALHEAGYRRFYVSGVGREHGYLYTK